MSMNNLFTQAGNFSSAISGGVDPRTGLYNLNLSLGTVKGNGGLGPDFPVTLSYSPLAQGSDMGFGDGVSLGFSTYDASSGRLSLSTGEQYQVNWSGQGNKLNIRQKKLDSYHMEKLDGKAYKIIHCSGDLEFLQGFDYGGDLKLPKQLVSVEGYTLHIDPVNLNGVMYLSRLRDESETALLNIDYDGNKTTLTFYPDTLEGYSVVLTTNNGYLTTITREAFGKESLVWTIGYDDTTMGKWATSLTYPGGMTETVTYPPRNSTEGHKFPDTAPLSGQVVMPYVITYKKTPGAGQPEQVSDYEYSAFNYLGYQSGINSWSGTDDNLYACLTDYEYWSAETRHNNAGENQVITRKYNNFHLQTHEITVCGDFSSVKDIDYYARKYTPFDDQPPQFQLPKSTTTTWTDSSDRKNVLSRTEVVLTEFAESGVQTKQTDADGTVTEWEYYPATGGGTDCPADPNGFTRFTKSETVTPGKTAYPSPVHKTVYTYATTEHAGTDVSALVMKSTEKHFADSVLLKTLTCEYGTNAAKTAGVLTGKTTTCHDDKTDYPTTEAVTFSDTSVIVSDGNDVKSIKARYTLTSHDGLTVTHSKTVSRMTGRVLKKTNSKGIVTAYTYNSLGWPVSRVRCKGNEKGYENTTTWDYTVDDTCGVSVTTTDASGNKVRHVLDGMGRLLQIKINDQDMDSSNPEPEFLMQLQDWDTLGRRRNSTAHDYLQAGSKTAPELTVKQTQTYDNWGQVSQSAGPDSVITHTETVLVPAPDADNCVWQTRSWQSGEKPTSITSGITVTTLDDNHNPVKTELYPKNAQPGKSTPYSTTTSEYDGWNRLRKQTDELGQTTTYEYDAFDRPTVTTLPDGTQTVRSYVPFSAAKLPVSISVVTGGNSTLMGTQTFDGLGRLLSTTSGGRTETFEYHAEHQRHPSRIIAADGATVDYTYIAELNDVPKTLSTSNTTPERAVSQKWTYDPLTGALQSDSEGLQKTTYGYAKSGTPDKVTVQSDDQPLPLSNSLSVRTVGGTPLTATDYAGVSQTLTPDNHGRPTTLEDQDVHSIQFYDDLGRVTQWTATSKKNGFRKTTILELDDYGRETRRTIETRDGDTLTDTLTISQAWSPKHQVIRRTTTRNTENLRDERYDFNAQRGWLMSYTVTGTTPPQDETGRPLSEVTFYYDSITGNMKGKTVTYADKNATQVSTLYWFNNPDDPCQLTSFASSEDNAPTSLTYDAAGRLTQDERGRILRYDALGRLYDVTDGKTLLSSYRYNASNQLAGQTTGDITTHHYYANNTLSYLEDNQKNSTRLTPYAQVSKGKNAGTWLTSTDMMGSVLSVTEGATQESHAFTPYGVRSSDTNTADNSVAVTGYNGERLDDTLTQYHLGNGYRAYNPALQRFTCPDSLSPFGDGGINPYIYCEGDPINRTDPTGHLFWEIALGVKTIVKAVRKATTMMADIVLEAKNAATSTPRLGGQKVVESITLGPDINNINLISQHNQSGALIFEDMYHKERRLNLIAHGTVRGNSSGLIIEGEYVSAQNFVENGLVGYDMDNYRYIRTLVCYSAEGGNNSFAGQLASITGKSVKGFVDVVKVSHNPEPFTRSLELLRSKDMSESLAYVEAEKIPFKFLSSKKNARRFNYPAGYKNPIYAFGFKFKNPLF
ncbi:RHS repeat-associated core domain-containing protein [Xenorhabdus bovienii]|uniref:RHS repeat-associated core domain-containing protein n=1 Tax=Xenorhabdus bovienii TaxID=40576 RepID=UPI0023B23CF5|nr:RHS repeat-associated core domain-containing protein [Xenorhabdus bovienii]MDE9437907.1 RHS repeat-associated core domain-containing protein [Xenorhabdus bovienii]MDE9499734.1 RHS repeat-associated core domain-containing protein [Xenorhabdus bovienii]